MAYTYLSLVNDVNRRLNEVALTSANFATAVGQQAAVKDAINYAIRDINQQSYEWPFNHVTYEETLVAGQTRYAFQADFKTLSMDTFRIKRDATFNNETKPLRLVSYESYLASEVDQEYNTSDTGIRTIPRNVFKTPDLEFGVFPVPDEAYVLVYEYYSLPTDLDLYTDVPSIPEQFRRVILDGALFYSYLFREDAQQAELIQGKFNQGIKQMRSIYINAYHYADSTMLNPHTRSSTLTHGRVS